MPDRSPLISAANTGTPAREKPSARTWSVTVLPVPVAPVTRPWRFAILSARYSGFSLLPTKILFVGSVVMALLGVTIPRGLCTWKRSAGRAVSFWRPRGTMMDVLINIDVDDLRKGIAFYEKALGLRVGR